VLGERLLLRANGIDVSLTFYEIHLGTVSPPSERPAQFLLRGGFDQERAEAVCETGMWLTISSSETTLRVRAVKHKGASFRNLTPWVRIFRLQHARAQDFAETLRVLLTGRISIEGRTNSLILRADPGEHEVAQEVIRQLDVETDKK